MRRIHGEPAFFACATLLASWLTGGVLADAQELNVARGKSVFASGPTWPGQVPQHLTDGFFDNQPHPLAETATFGFYYEVDLEREYSLDRILVFNRIACCPERLSNYRVSVHADDSGTPGSARWSADVRADGSHSSGGQHDLLTAALDPNGTMAGRFIRITNLSSEAYNPQIAELEAYTVPFVGSDHPAMRGTT